MGGPTGGKGHLRGHKRALPIKSCVQCGRPMSWRRAWAKTWDSVKYCSERCRGEAHRRP